MVRVSVLLAVLAMLTLSASCFAADKADRVVILKSEHVLLLLARGELLRSYPIALGQQPVGPKRVQGDKRTPEGLYFINGRNPRSRYHLALRLSYPNATDVRRARAVGLSPGGDIMIHGLPVNDEDSNPSVFYADWTEGCIAVGNRAIEEIWDLVPDGTPVEIRQ